MKAILCALLTSFGLLNLNAETPGASTRTAVLASRMLDVSSGKMIANPVLLIEADRISKVGSNLEVPSDYRIINLGDATLLPGLIDCHTHLCSIMDPNTSEDDSLPLRSVRMSTADRALLGAAMGRELLESGITTVRDVGNSGLNADVALREATTKLWVVGPRMYVATRGLAPIGAQFPRIQPELQGMIGTEYSVLTGADEARKAVRQAFFDGADFIKAYAITGMSYEELKVIVEEAHRLKMKVAVHATKDAAIRQAVEAGCDSIEHGYQMSDETLRLMASRKVVLVPTTYKVEFWKWYQGLRGLPAESNDSEWAMYEPFAQMKMRTLAKAVTFGVPIAAGSDMYIDLPGLTRGQASLLVFRAYTEAGMTPLQVIRAGTMNGADLIGEKAMCGRLESGRFADVIAVSGDPISDISELERVKFVMSRGKVVRNDLRAPSK